MPTECSIPSSLVGLVPPRHVTDEERRERRLREARVCFATCPECGGRATREEVLVHRPGQPSVERVLLRCLRYPPPRKGLPQDPRRCPIHIESETPAEAGLEVPVSQPVTCEEQRDIEVPVEPIPVLCPCGCGDQVPPKRKFASQRCSNLFNARKSVEARRARAAEEAAAQEPGPAPPTPELRERVAQASSAVSNAVSLLAIAAQLLELTPEEADLVTRLVEAERARRSA
jgi:hypothetical protein